MHLPSDRPSRVDGARHHPRQPPGGAVAAPEGRTLKPATCRLRTRATQAPPWRFDRRDAATDKLSVAGAGHHPNARPSDRRESATARLAVAEFGPSAAARRPTKRPPWPLDPPRSATDAVTVAETRRRGRVSAERLRAPLMRERRRPVVRVRAHPSTRSKPLLWTAQAHSDGRTSPIGPVLAASRATGGTALGGAGVPSGVLTRADGPFVHGVSPRVPAFPFPRKVIER